MLLNLAQMKLWHLGRQHVNSDSGVRHTAASLSLEDKAVTFQDSGNERLREASGKRGCGQGNRPGNTAMINSHVDSFHLTEKHRSGHSPQNEKCPSSSRKDSLHTALAVSFFDNVQQKRSEHE